jgi:hypothetical protein
MPLDAEGNAAGEEHQYAQSAEPAGHVAGKDDAAEVTGESRGDHLQQRCCTNSPRQSIHRRPLVICKRWLIVIPPTAKIATT